MLSLQWIPGLPVVKLLKRGFPMHQRKIRAIVFQMATHAVFSVAIFQLKSRVIPVVSGKPLRDLSMAIEALECRSA